MGKSGRPPAPDELVKKPGLSIRLNASEMATIQRAAKESGMRTSAWVRKSLLYIAIRGIRIT